MRIMVTGGRDYADRRALWAILDELKPSVLIHGHCPTGADWLADEWAKARNVHVIREPASWRIAGKLAGMIRNIRMIERHKPELVVAAPGGDGTRHAVTNALLRGIPVRRIK